MDREVARGEDPYRRKILDRMLFTMVPLAALGFAAAVPRLVSGGRRAHVGGFAVTFALLFWVAARRSWSVRVRGGSGRSS